MHVRQARRLTQVSSPAGEAGSVRRRLRMSPCTLFSCSRYLRISGAWLALSASDFFRSARCAASSPFPLFLRPAAATALISVASCRIGLDGSPPSVA